MSKTKTVGVDINADDIVRASVVRSSLGLARMYDGGMTEAQRKIAASAIATALGIPTVESLEQVIAEGMKIPGSRLSREQTEACVLAVRYVRAREFSALATLAANPPETGGAPPLLDFPGDSKPGRRVSPETIRAVARYLMGIADEADAEGEQTSNARFIEMHDALGVLLNAIESGDSRYVEQAAWMARLVHNRATGEE